MAALVDVLAPGPTQRSDLTASLLAPPVVETLSELSGHSTLTEFLEAHGLAVARTELALISLVRSVSIGANRRITRQHSTAIFRALRSGARNWAIVMGSDQSGEAGDMEVRVLRGGRTTLRATAPWLGVLATGVEFPDPLGEGDLHTVVYESGTPRQWQDVSSSGRRLEESDGFIFGSRNRMSVLSVEVQFLPDDLPARVWGSNGDIAVATADYQPDSEGCVTMVRENVTGGNWGIHWSWEPAS